MRQEPKKAVSYHMVELIQALEEEDYLGGCENDPYGDDIPNDENSEFCRYFGNFYLFKNDRIRAFHRMGVRYR